MTPNKFVLTGLALLGVASTALAGGRNPGSLLLFPEFDNRVGNLTLVTVTNTNADVVNGTVDVEFIYIGRRGLGGVPLACLEFNRTHRLTANDTLTLWTSAHNPQMEEGFLYAFAKHRNTGEPIVFNWLIGNLMTFLGPDALDYSMNPVAFRGIGNGVITNLDGDGNRDLDGLEYEGVTSEILIPRFLGQNGASYNSDLILLGLSGGALFDTTVGFWVYNDNEEQFSSQHTFRCWDRISLLSISGVFGNAFLRTTNHAPNEIIGAPSRESGWMRVYGQSASSTAEQIDNPAIYAVLIEKIVGFGASDLPFEATSLRTNGSLLPRNIFGDGGLAGPVNGDNR